MAWLHAALPAQPHADPIHHLLPAMRLIVRMMLLLSLVLGVSVALAWAWDRSDDLAARQADPARPAESTSPAR